jgi:hypothetical protein
MQRGKFGRPDPCCRSERQAGGWVSAWYSRWFSRGKMILLKLALQILQFVNKTCEVRRPDHELQ